MEQNDSRLLQLNIENILLFLAILFVPVQDFVLFKTPLHMFGRILSNFPLLILFVYVMLIKRKQKITMKYILAGGWFILFSLIMGMWTSTSIEFTLRKIITQGIVFFFWIYFYESVKKYQYFDKAVKCAFILNIVGYIACDVLGVFNEGIMHVNTYPEGRWRGFTAEASWFCFTSAILGGLTFLKAKNRLAKIIVIVITLFLSIGGNSKGIVICGLLALLINISIFSKVKTFYKCIYILLIIFMAWIMAEMYLINAFYTDLSDATSFATRASLDIAYCITFVNYPLGTGVGGAITVVSQYALSAFDYLQRFVPVIVLKDNELLESVAREDGSGVLIANMFLVMLCYFGIPFLFMFSKLVYKTMKFLSYNRDICLTYLFIIVIAGNMTYVSWGYDSILVFVMIAREKMKVCEYEK